MIPEKDTDLNEVKNAELLEYLKAELGKDTAGKDLIDRITRKITEINNAFFDNTIKTMKEEDYKFTVNPYQLGDVYKILNEEEYCLIRDGFVTIGGEASTGKTSFLSDLAIDLLKHNTDTCFMFYTLDDSIHISGKRIISQLNKKNLFKGDYDNYLHKEPHNEILSRIILREKVNIIHLKREAEAAKKKTNCKKIIIGIDYLQAIPALPEYSGDRRQLFNDNLKALKEKQIAIQEAGGCILFCLSQLNRDSKTDGYRYRETSEIENQSDVCIDIELPRKTQETGKDKRTTSDRETDDRIIRVQKNKMGKRGMTFHTTISRAFNFGKLDFEQGKDTKDKTPYKKTAEDLLLK